MHIVQLVREDGEALGPVELSRPDWPPGSIIHTRGDRPDLRVIEVVDAAEDDPEQPPILVVQEV